ncbi:MAG: IS630 family transposase [Clostridia bacterium]|nr:IS630 family transposase [Clostridia bacterium]
MEDIQLVNKDKHVRIMFQDEVGFGRINTPQYCWTDGKRPSVPCHHIREYRYVFGAVDPIPGDDCFLVAPQCNTVCMNVFLDTLSKQYRNDEILLICDGAAWHKSGTLVIPSNIHIQHIPPYTPEMNPIEQVWREIRTRGFRNEVFKTFNDVINRLCETNRSITPDVIRSITGRKWILPLL